MAGSPSATNTWGYEEDDEDEDDDDEDDDDRDDDDGDDDGRLSFGNKHLRIHEDDVETMMMRMMMRMMMVMMMKMMMEMMMEMVMEMMIEVMITGSSSATNTWGYEEDDVDGDEPWSAFPIGHFSLWA